MKTENKTKKKYHFLNKAFFWNLGTANSRTVEDEKNNEGPILATD